MKRFFLSLVTLLSLVSAAHAETTTAYDRVMKSGTIRCGYVSWPPYLVKDPNTGEFSGISYEYMNAVGAELGLKVEWAEETGWGTFQEGLATDRYDMMCVGVWQSGQRAKVGLLSDPIYYNAVYVWAREDDDRFADLASVNKEGIKIAVVDGDVTADVRKLKFPNATSYGVTGDSSQLALSVSTKKADVSFENPSTIALFNKTSDIKLKMVGTEPARVFGNVYAFKNGEFALKHMVDAAIGAINTSGQATTIVNDYAPDFIPVAEGYAEGGQ